MAAFWRPAVTNVPPPWDRYTEPGYVLPGPRPAQCQQRNPLPRRLGGQPVRQAPGPASGGPSSLADSRPDESQHPAVTTRVTRVHHAPNRNRPAGSASPPVTLSLPPVRGPIAGSHLLLVPVRPVSLKFPHTYRPAPLRILPLGPRRWPQSSPGCPATIFAFVPMSDEQPGSARPGFHPPRRASPAVMVAAHVRGRRREKITPPHRPARGKVGGAGPVRRRATSVHSRVGPDERATPSGFLPIDAPSTMLRPCVRVAASATLP